VAFRINRSGFHPRAEKAQIVKLIGRDKTFNPRES
jgi:hypothetical protein